MPAIRILQYLTILTQFFQNRCNRWGCKAEATFYFRFGVRIFGVWCANFRGMVCEFSGYGVRIFVVL